MSMITIPFNQISLYHQLNTFKHRELIATKNKYSGLCDLVCNRVLIDDLLGKGNDPEQLKNKVTVKRLNEEGVRNSHLMKIYSLWRKLLAYLFGIYPDNIFSFREQKSLIRRSNRGKDKTLNLEVLQKGFNKIAANETLKVELFHRKGLSMRGHSFLIKKLSASTYSFFDPDHGEKRDLNFYTLCALLNVELCKHKRSDFFMTRGSDFLNRVQTKLGKLHKA